MASPLPYLLPNQEPGQVQIAQISTAGESEKYMRFYLSSCFCIEVIRIFSFNLDMVFSEVKEISILLK